MEIGSYFLFLQEQIKERKLCVVNGSGGNNFCRFTTPRPKSLMSDKDSKINVHEREIFVVHVAHVGVGCRHRLVLADSTHDT